MRTPKRGKGVPVGAAIGPSVRYFRENRELSQPQLARVMELLGFRWLDTTVAKVEAGDRKVTVDELVALCIVFREPIDRILTPAEGGDVDILVGKLPVAQVDLYNGLRGDRDSFPIIPEVEKVTWKAWASVTGDTGLRSLVDAEMAERDAAREKLGIEVTESQRRRERNELWESLALEHEYGDRAAELAPYVRGTQRRIVRGVLTVKDEETEREGGAQ